MRKFLKNNILEIFDTIYQAHNSVKKYVSKKDFQNAVSILEDCQNTAIQIGTIIENSEGEGFVTVRFLEEYCEAVYEVSSNLSYETNENKIQKTLDKKLMNAESSVKNDIKVRLEVVFCPYKASMWDSLESVWKAANDDPDCDAYVVPIPYYDRKSDGSFGEFHYEGGEYPNYVPVVHYETYNFENRRPDVVYIHNPYDEYNSVTSVDPRFYSHELKKYTDCLVYIPYFVLAEPDPNNPENLENISHFVLTSGVISADRVIVQSEAMRQAYIKILLTKLGDTVENRKILENKISGTGSPKFDKIMSTTKEYVHIPDEWLKIIKKPDGTWKKIVFYNTSIGALLQYNEKMLKKMCDVFNIFYENRDDIALLWRPHPLIQATIESMRPMLWKVYSDIVEKYKSDGWGIYDDTPDLDRAIVLSDAYYGDPSSVVQLCQKAEKPIMIQNVEIMEA